MNKDMNAKKVLNNVNRCIEELTELNSKSRNYDFSGRCCVYGYGANRRWMFFTDSVYEELSIFDWWTDLISLSQLRQMKRFLEIAIKLGFTGYVCFKVGVKGCAHGMWAHKKESLTGYSPDGDVLYHSFRNGDNYWDAEINSVWLHTKYATKEDTCPGLTLNQIKREIEVQ